MFNGKRKAEARDSPAGVDPSACCCRLQIGLGNPQSSERQGISGSGLAQGSMFTLFTPIMWKRSPKSMIEAFTAGLDFEGETQAH